MKIKTALLTGLLASAVVTVAGPDTWRAPAPPKPKAPCCGECLPGGGCCDVKHNYLPGHGGRGVTRTTTASCKDSCHMPAKQRSCCVNHCIR